MNKAKTIVAFNTVTQKIKSGGIYFFLLLFFSKNPGKCMIFTRERHAKVRGRHANDLSASYIKLWGGGEIVKKILGDDGNATFFFVLA